MKFSPGSLPLHLLYQALTSVCEWIWCSGWSQQTVGSNLCPCKNSEEDRLPESLFLLHGLEETPARGLGGLGLTIWSALSCLSIFVCKMNDNCSLLGQVEGIRRWGLSKGSSVPGTQSARRKCHTQLGAGLQVSVRHSTEAEEPGAGRL